MKPAAPRRGGVGGKVFGATAVGALAVGIFLGQYLPDLGFVPGGKGFGLGQPATSQGARRPETETEETVSPAPPAAAEKQPRKSGEAPVIVRVDGHDLILEDANGATQVAALEEIVKAIQSVQPNADGVRVKIAPTPEARAKAESDLKEALRAAGVLETEILWSE